MTLPLQFFKKNIARFPNKSDAYDSLADGYEANGDLAMALEMREKALAMSYEENVENGAFKTRLATCERRLRKVQATSYQVPELENRSIDRIIVGTYSGTFTRNGIHIMKTNKIFASLTLSLCLASLLGCTEPETLPASPSAAAESKEANLLKTGLTERIRIEGQEVDYQSLEQRQAHYDVPGVSVAFMRNGN